MVLTIDEEGVSEVIGAVLLVSLVVLGVAIVAVALFSQPPPSEVPHLSVVAGTTVDNTTFVLLHEGGDTLAAGNYRIYVDNGSGLVDRTDEFALAGDDIWSIGENLTYAGGDVAQIEQAVISVVDAGGETVIAGRAYAAGAGDVGRYVDEGGSGTVPLIASFTASATTGEAPLVVQFTDASTGMPTAWLWSFGDGATSTDQHPAHTYADAGTYTVSLTVSNAVGSDTATKTGYITVTGPPPAGHEVELNTAKDKSGTLQEGGYLEFGVTGAYSYVKIEKKEYNLDIGDTVRLTLGSRGYGNIYIGGGNIDTFAYDDVSLSINGEFKKYGDVKGIWINGYDDLSSTLTLKVPADDEWTRFTVDGGTIINGDDERGIVLYNLMPGSDGVMNLNNPSSSKGVYFTGSVSDYTLLEDSDDD